MCYDCVCVCVCVCLRRQTVSADGGDHGREREQNHRLCGDEEALWWSHQEDEAARVRRHCYESTRIHYYQYLMAWSNSELSLIFTLHCVFCCLAGQPCVSMETRASQKEIGYSLVRITVTRWYFPVERRRRPRRLPADIVFNPTEFRSGKAPILVATDVASRGLGMSAHTSSYSCRLSHDWLSLCLILSAFFLFDLLYFFPIKWYGVYYTLLWSNTRNNRQS